MGLPTKQNKNCLRHCQPSFPGRKIKKAENKFLPLHYQPNFQERRQKNVHKKKVYQQNEIKVFYFPIDPVSRLADKNSINTL